MYTKKDMSSDSFDSLRWGDKGQRWGEEEAWGGGAGVPCEEEGEGQEDHTDREGGAGEERTGGISPHHKN